MPTYEDLNYDNNLNKPDESSSYDDSVYNNETNELETSEPATTSGSSDPLDTTDDTTPITSVSKLTSGVFQAAEFIVEASGRIRSGQTAYDTGIGWWIGDVAGTKKLSIGNSAGNKLTWDGTTLSISGSLVAGDISIGTSPNWFRVDSSGNTWWGAVLFANAPASITPAGLIKMQSGTIGGFVIGSDYIRDAANSMGLASTVTAGNDVRFWAGDTFANRSTAPFQVLENGNVRLRFVSSDNDTGMVNNFTDFTSAVAGGGAITKQYRLSQVTTGFTASSSAKVYTEFTQIGDYWECAGDLEFNINYYITQGWSDVAGGAEEIYVKYGQNNTIDTGAADEKVFGIKLSGDITGITAVGFGRFVGGINTVTLSTTLLNAQKYKISIIKKTGRLYFAITGIGAAGGVDVETVTGDIAYNPSGTVATPYFTHAAKNGLINTAAEGIISQISYLFID